MGEKKDPFSVLGLDRGALEGLPFDEAKKQIKAAYRKLAAKYHPDRPTRDIDRFKDVTAAHDALLQPEKLSREQAAQWQTWQKTPGNRAPEFDFDDLESAFRQAWERRENSSYGRAAPDETRFPVDQRFRSHNFYGAIDPGSFNWRFPELPEISDDEFLRIRGQAQPASLHVDTAMLLGHPVFSGGSLDFEQWNSIVYYSLLGMLDPIAWGNARDSIYQADIPPYGFLARALITRETCDVPYARFVQLMYTASFALDGEGEQRTDALNALWQITQFMADYGHGWSAGDTRGVAMELLAHYCRAYQSSLREAMNVLIPGQEHAGAERDTPMDWSKVRADPERLSVYAAHRQSQVREQTLTLCRQYQILIQRDLTAYDLDLVWALRRAMEEGITPEREAGEHAQGQIAEQIYPPRTLFQFQQHTADKLLVNLGFDSILRGEDFRRNPDARADRFYCDPVFIGEFLRIMAGDYTALRSPIDGSIPNTPGWITGRLRDFSDCGFCIEQSTSLGRPVPTCFLALITPSTERTKEVLSSMSERGLIDQLHLRELLEYGYMYRHHGILNPHTVMDAGFLHILEDMLGVERPRDVGRYLAASSMEVPAPRKDQRLKGIQL